MRKHSIRSAGIFFAAFGNLCDQSMKSELELLRTLAEAEEDVMNGRVSSMQNTFDDIRKSLSERRVSLGGI